jgi:hypothetical protein
MIDLKHVSRGGVFARLVREGPHGPCLHYPVMNTIYLTFLA